MRLNFIPKPCLFACIFSSTLEQSGRRGSIAVVCETLLLRSKTNVLLENSNSKIVRKNKLMYRLLPDWLPCSKLCASTHRLNCYFVHYYNADILFSSSIYFINHWLLLSNWFTFWFSGCPQFISFSYYLQFWLKYHPTE